jgi:hypothetical protein
MTVLLISDIEKRSFVINSVDVMSLLFVWNAMMEPVFLSGRGVEPLHAFMSTRAPILGWYVVKSMATSKSIHNGSGLRDTDSVT